MTKKSKQKSQINLEEKPEGIWKKLCRKLAEHKYLTNGAATLLLSLAGAIGYIHNSINNDFLNLITQTREMVDLYGKTASFCTASVRNPNALSDFEKAQILAFEGELYKKKGELNATHSNLGALVSPKTYLAVHELACWIDHLVLEDGIKICVKDLKSASKMIVWRNKILEEIAADQQKHQKLTVILEDFFLSYFQNPRNKKYKNPGCDLKKISTY